MAGLGAGGEGPGGRFGHRRTLNRHPSLGPDYDWFDDDEDGFGLGDLWPDDRAA
jgi:hypothetical protein